MAGLSPSLFHGLPLGAVEVRADDSPDRCARRLPPSAWAGASPLSETGRLPAQSPASRAGALLPISLPAVERTGTLSRPLAAAAKVQRPHVVKIGAGRKQLFPQRVQDGEGGDSAKHFGLPLHSDGDVFSVHSSLPDALIKARGRATGNLQHSGELQ